MIETLIATQTDLGVREGSKKRNPRKKIVSTIRLEDTIRPLTPHIDRTRGIRLNQATRLDLVTIDIAGRKRTMVYKKYPEAMNIKPVFTAYTKAKSEGIPVAHTFRRIEEENAILMTDLTEGGKNVVISVNNITIEDLSPMQVEQMINDGTHPLTKLYNDNLQLMQNFGHAIPILSSPSLTQAFDSWATKLAQVGLGSGFIDWFLVIKPSGEYEVLMNDFEEVEISPASKDNHTASMNRLYLEYFRHYMNIAQVYAKDPEEGKIRLMEYAQGPDLPFDIDDDFSDM